MSIQVDFFIKNIYNLIMVLQQIDIFGGIKNIKLSVKPKKNKECILLSQKIQKLEMLYNQLYETLNIPLLEQKDIIIYSKTIVAYPDERQAELIGTQLLSIDERIKKHKEYLYRNDILRNIKEQHLG